MTDQVERWHPGFIRRHQKRCGKVAWPAATTDKGIVLREDWCGRMVAARVTEAEADAASALVAKDPPKEPGVHPLAIVRLVREARERARGERFREEMQALSLVAREFRLLERAQVLLNRRDWSQLPLEERARIWREAGELMPINRLRTFRERSAWALAGFPDPTEELRTPSEAREIVAELEELYGELFDPTPRAGLFVPTE